MTRAIALLTLMAATTSAVRAGSIGGPKITREIVLPESTDSYVIAFRADDLAAVVVSGDGGTDLDLYVYDGNGNLIAKDDDETDDCAVRWSPRWTGKFRIRVVNRGSLPNKYTIASN